MSMVCGCLGVRVCVRRVCILWVYVCMYVCILCACVYVCMDVDHVEYRYGRQAYG